MSKFILDCACSCGGGCFEWLDWPLELVFDLSANGFEAPLKLSRSRPLNLPRKLFSLDDDEKSISMTYLCTEDLEIVMRDLKDLHVC